MKTSLFPSLCELWATSSSYEAGKKAVKLIKLPGVKAGFVFGPRTIFLTSKITNLLSSKLITHKTEIGTAKGQRLLIAIHLDQSNHLGNQQQVLCFAVPFASLSTLGTNAGSFETFSQSQMGIVF
jgi:hypothetical protein